MRRLVVIAALVGACSSGGAGKTPEPEPTPTPTPAWSLVVGDVTYTKTAIVGGDIRITVEIRNKGKAANHGTKLQFSDLDKHADIEGCVPECEVDTGFGVYAHLPGIPAGKTKTYKVNFVASSPGASRWSLCIYDDDIAGEQGLVRRRNDDDPLRRNGTTRPSWPASATASSSSGGSPRIGPTSFCAGGSLRRRREGSTEANRGTGMRRLSGSRSSFGPGDPYLGATVLVADPMPVALRPYRPTASAVLSAVERLSLAARLIGPHRPYNRRLAAT